jgi:hypothetical protein
MWEDEVRIPPPGYRSAPQRRAAEARRLMLVVGGIAAVLVLGVGGYFVATGSGPEGVPVIQAPATPVKIKPADPGGLDVNAQTSALLGGSGVAGDDNVAPAPEAPDPAALAAAANQEQSSPPPVPPASGAAAPAASSASAVASTAPAPSPAPVAPAAVSVPSIPETAGAPVSQQTAMNVAPPSREAAQVHNLAQEYNPPVERHGHLRVQIAALNSQEAALREWDHLTHRMPSLFARHRPIFEQAHVNGHTYWRVRTAGFASVSEATKFCEDVHVQGGSCTVASF